MALTQGPARWTPKMTDLPDRESPPELRRRRASGPVFDVAGSLIRWKLCKRIRGNLPDFVLKRVQRRLEFLLIRLRKSGQRQ